MSFSWVKLGCIFDPTSRTPHPKLRTHAANPLPVHIGGNLFRIYYSGRDDEGRSSVGGIDFDIVTRTIIKDFKEPFFEHGPKKSFYANGVSVGCVYRASSTLYMTFMGWQSPSDGHWRGDIGRLIVEADLTLELDCDRPLLSSDPVDPISLSYPWILGDEVDGYTMWYGSTHTWDAGNGEMLHVINRATSSDGQSWMRHGLGVPFILNVAQAFSRPTVVPSLTAGYDMWFSYRSGSGQKYRIGYAHSLNLVDWKLDANGSGIDVSSDGWDSEMIEYPYVFDHNNDRYMIYNGNGYGRTGFGLAKLIRK